MTLAEIEKMTDAVIDVTIVAEITKSDAHAIRVQAHEDKTQLGYPTIIIGNRVKVPREAFIWFMKYGYAPPAIMGDTP